MARDQTHSETNHKWKYHKHKEVRSNLHQAPLALEILTGKLSPRNTCL